jgi:hypothetical protein
MKERWGAKDVWIVEKHNHVLEAWAEIRAILDAPPRLVTLDHHTDTFTAFAYYLAQIGELRVNMDLRDYLDRIDQESAKMSYAVPSTIASAIPNLRNDEHIDAAIRTQILDLAFVIQLQHSNGTQKKTHANQEEMLSYVRRNGCSLEEALDNAPFTAYDLPENRIFILPGQVLTPDGRMVEDGEDACNNVIETVNLDSKSDLISEMAREALGRDEILNQPFLLDIDLDYFHSSGSISPTDPTRFHDLIQNALAITVARESEWVLCRRLPGEQITADGLLERLKQHIQHCQLERDGTSNS